MLAALRVVWRGIQQFEHYGWLYVLMNMLAVALSIPIITAPAAYAGLCHLSHTAQTGVTASASDFWEGFRANLGRGILVAITNIIILIVLWRNFLYYSGETSVLFYLLRGVWLIFLFLLVSVQLYLWPLLEEMEQPNLRGALRNALVMTMANPLFTLTLLLVILVLLAISLIAVAPIVLLTSSLMACIATTAVLDRLNRYRAQRASQ